MNSPTFDRHDYMIFCVLWINALFNFIVSPCQSSSYLDNNGFYEVKVSVIKYCTNHDGRYVKYAKYGHSVISI